MSENTNTRKMKALVLRQVAEKGRKALVTRIGTTDTRISRFFSEDAGAGKLTFSEMLALIDEYGLKLVEADAETIDKEKKKALAVLAMDELRRMTEE